MLTVVGDDGFIEDTVDAVAGAVVAIVAIVVVAAVLTVTDFGSIDAAVFIFDVVISVVFLI